MEGRISTPRKRGKRVRGPPRSGRVDAGWRLSRHGLSFYPSKHHVRNKTGATPHRAEKFRDARGSRFRGNLCQRRRSVDLKMFSARRKWTLTESRRRAYRGQSPQACLLEISLEVSVSRRCLSRISIST